MTTGRLHQRGTGEVRTSAIPPAHLASQNAKLLMAVREISISRSFPFILFSSVATGLSECIAYGRAFFPHFVVATKNISIVGIKHDVDISHRVGEEQKTHKQHWHPQNERHSLPAAIKSFRNTGRDSRSENAC
jgi:hypothetical protein